VEPGATRAELEAELANLENSIRQIEAQRADFPPDELDAFRRGLRAERDAIQRRLNAQSEQQPPEAIAGAAEDGRTVLGTISPRSLTVERNGLRTADTASITIDHRDAPFDPRSIRSAAVENLLGVIPASEFGAGVEGERREDGSLRSIVERRRDGSVVDSSTRFVGFVDEWEVMLDGEDGDTITLDCRDMTALLLDEKLPQGSGIDLTLPLDRGISALLEDSPSTRGIEVVYGVEGESAPVPADALPASRRARRGRVAQRARRGGTQMSLWDHITDVCTQVGVVPVFEDYQLRIVQPRTFYAGRSQARRMVYGRR
jgi:hypothetical protein